ncbi:MAG TPA: lactate racemase domain-containing protein, partial [Spirochaetota bacterium]|nr:lactate racemase domain-containing protein [Spirochaetota bacterium]
MIYWQQGSETTELSTADLHNALSSVYDKLGQKSRVMAIPPDFSRYHSGTGPLLQHTYKYYGSLLQAILPALGTHAPMTDQEIKTMFGSIPRHLFYEHRFRQDIKTLGTVPGSFVKEVSEGKVDFSWPAQVNKMLVDDNFDLIISLGQVVPHEVVGMANYNKNIFVGTGGVEGINKSHFLGAAYGMERMMGRADTPVRRVLEYASREFAADLPILYILTVMGQNEAGNNVMRGLFIGDDYRCFNAAAELSLKVNFTLLEKPLSKIVTYLDPREFKSTWLGNKAIYRTRMALADQGELIILAPGVKEFGEDKEIDRLIR